MAVELVTGHAGTPHVTADQVAEFNKGTIGANSSILSTRSKCACTVLNANTIQIGTGDVYTSGRHIAIGTSEQLKINNGTQSQRRNDIVGIRYKKSSAGVESTELEVIVGKPSSTTPVDPSLPTSTITSYTSNAFIPLYRIRLNGLTIGTPERMIDISAPAEQSIINKIYPVGAVYISFSSINPSTLFGGTWERIEDRFLFASTSAGVTGGEKEHKLTVDEMPNHVHSIDTHPYDADSGSPYKYTRAGTGVSIGKDGTDSKGGDKPHNNMPPYITVYMWRRTR